MQCDPEADGPRPGQDPGSALWAKSAPPPRCKVKIGEDDDAGGGMLEHLGAPAGVLSGVEAFAKHKAQRLEHADDAREERPGAAKGVMVVVRPAQSQPVLPRLLHLCGAVSRLPVVAFDFKDQMTGQIARARSLDDTCSGFSRSC